MITLFQPHTLWTNGGRIRRDKDGKPTNWRTRPVGTWVSAEDYDGIVRWISSAMPANDKESEGAFTLAKLRGGRCVENVDRVTALGLDGDTTGKPAAQIHDLLRAYRHIVYSTHSSTPSDPRWRAIIALSRTATAQEHYRYIRNVHANLADIGVNLDRQCVDPCRLWYLPCYKQRDHFDCYSSDGQPFDVAAALVTAAEMDAERRRETEQRARRSATLGGNRVARARAYVAKMPAGIQGSNGSTATYNVARKLLKDFELSDGDAWTALLEYNARCKPPWSEKELAHKLNQAARARVSNPVAERGAP